MLLPPIDECAKKVGNKYAVAIIAARRALELRDKRPADFVGSNEKEITFALREILSGVVEKTTVFTNK